MSFRRFPFSMLIALLAAPPLHAQQHEVVTPSCAELTQKDTVFSYVLLSREPQPLDFEKDKSCFAEAFKASPHKDVIAEIEGRAIYRLYLEVDGRVSKICYLRLPHPLVDEVYHDCLLSMEFSPGSDSKGPVATWVTIPLNIGIGR
jgi:hypothetical protein